MVYPGWARLRRRATAVDAAAVAATAAAAAVVAAVAAANVGAASTTSVTDARAMTQDQGSRASHEPVFFSSRKV